MKEKKRLPKKGKLTFTKWLRTLSNQIIFKLNQGLASGRPAECSHTARV